MFLWRSEIIAWRSVFSTVSENCTSNSKISEKLLQERPHEYESKMALGSHPALIAIDYIDHRISGNPLKPQQQLFFRQSTRAIHQLDTSQYEVIMLQIRSKWAEQILWDGRVPVIRSRIKLQPWSQMSLLILFLWVRLTTRSGMRLFLNDLFYATASDAKNLF